MSKKTDPRNNQDRHVAVDDRRSSERRPPAETRLLMARLSDGSLLDVVDVSSGGALVETDSCLAIGARVGFRLVTEDGVILISGSVMRTSVLRNGSNPARFRTAVRFDFELDSILESAMRKAMERLLRPFGSVR